MDFEPSQLKTQKDRTKIEQAVIEKLILKYFENYYVGLAKNPEEEEDKFEDIEEDIPDELRRDEHAAYVFNSLLNVGKNRLSFIFFILPPFALPVFSKHLPF